MKQLLAILGSTGSIGRQTLDIARLHPDLFEVSVLTAKSRWQELVGQAREFQPDSVVITDNNFYGAVSEALSDLPIKVYTGQNSLEQIVRSSEVTTVVNALVGYAGLAPTVAALRCGKKLALANKESLVVAGESVMRLVGTEGSSLIPIDSEHSAIFQCLVGETSPIHKLIITASGGSLREVPVERLDRVSVEQVLHHPNWNMGAKITVDSATLVNKGFEVIEAHHLFGVKPSQIEVSLHPQSVVHSMVEFEDGAIKAQLGVPDMRVPIQYALSFPERLASPAAKFSFADCRSLNFEEVDRVKYPALDIAYDCLGRGGNAGCVMNGSNEVAVAAFLNGKIRFTSIVKTIEYALSKVAFVKNPTLDDYSASNDEARRVAEAFIHQSQI